MERWPHDIVHIECHPGNFSADVVFHDYSLSSLSVIHSCWLSSSTYGSLDDNAPVVYISESLIYSPCVGC